MSFKKVSEYNESLVNKGMSGPINPWYRFPKTREGYIDRDADPVVFRFLDPFSDLIMAFSHWDSAIRRKVSCNRQLGLNRERKPMLRGNCFYCTRAKEQKTQWMKDKEAGLTSEKYPKIDGRLDSVFVARVAVMNRDEAGHIVSQEFRLLPIPSLDYLYAVASGAYKFLSEFGDNRRKLRKPSCITKYWWTLTPRNVLSMDELADKEDLEVVPEGLFNDKGEEFDIMNASPFDYDEAMKMREKLEAVNKEAEAYLDSGEELKDQEKEKQQEVKEDKPAQPKTMTNKKQQDQKEVDLSANNYGEDDDIPPF